MNLYKILWVIGFLYLSVSTVRANEKLDLRSKPVIVDFTMAEKMLDWLVFAKHELSEEKRKIEFMKLVATTGGSKAIIAHWSRFDSNWNIDAFYHFIAEHLGFVETQKELVDPEGNPTPFSMRKRLWSDAFQNPKPTMHLIEQLKTIDWNERLGKNVKPNLPPEIAFSVDFYFVLFGASNAFTVNDVIGFDVLQLPLDTENNLALDDIFRTASHELHHIGFSLATDKYMGNIENLERTTLVGLMAAEGIATYLYQQPFKRFLNCPVEDAQSNGVIRDWQDKISRLPQMYPTAEADINLGLLGKFEGKTLYTKWLEGYQGDAYILGTAMIRLIDQELGREKIIELIRDYRKLLSFYNLAAKKANEAIDKDERNQRNSIPRNRHFIFSHQLVQSVEKYTGITN